MQWQRMVEARALRGESLAQAIEKDRAVAKRQTPSLPRVKFLEGPGPERFDEPSTRAA